MSNSMPSNTCTFVCWLIAALVGLLCAYFAWASFGALAAILVAVVLGVLVALALTQLFCAAPRPAAAAPVTGDSPREATSQAGKEDAGKAPVGAAPAQADTEAGAAPSALRPVAQKAQDVARKAEADEKTRETPAPASASSSETGSTAKVASPAKADKADPASAKKPPASGTKAANGKPASGGTKPAVASGAGAAIPAPTAKTTSAEKPGDIGGSAAVGPGSRPEALSGPRGSGADDLKKIKGVGPKLEALLNDLGFYHFDQIARWNDAEVAWVDENLKGFKGRVSRDNWVAQAATLAEGGETEFSKRVGDGDVY
ncbi:hypothetical protein [Roseovarius sp. SCSIO 43702]|uniref:hypothetical protein n=1 Tax=Roseovarius sp. SCSIO 43702 TaxID=2823043 RepID=UPI0021761A35|nr:hypothetical protein [Roseovarius sp. SCSIO 43702]